MNKNELVFKNENLNLEIRTVKNNDGSISVNLEDAARGLGFTTVATSGNEVVRWSRVKHYLNEFGVSQQVGKGSFIPESVFYLLAMKANNDSAKSFQVWVAKDVLPAIRKTGTYKVPSNSMEALELMFEAQKQSNEKLQEMDKRISNVENTTTIVSSQQLTLTKIAKATAIHVLGGKDTIAYCQLSNKVFRSMWRDYKDYFKIASYKDTLKTDYEKAMKYLKEWRPDTNLRYEIDLCGFDW